MYSVVICCLFALVDLVVLFNCSKNTCDDDSDVFLFVNNVVYYVVVVVISRHSFFFFLLPPSSFLSSLLVLPIFPDQSTLVVSVLGNWNVSCRKFGCGYSIFLFSL